MSYKFINRESKSHKLKKLIMSNLLKMLIIPLTILMIIVTCWKANSILDTNTLLAKLLIEKYFNTEILPKIDLGQNYSEDDFYELTSSMDNRISLNKFIKDNVLQIDYTLIDDVAYPSFVFALSNSGSSAFKSNFWKIHDIDYSDGTKTSNFDVIFCNFLDYSNPEAMVLLYKLMNQESGKYADSYDEMILYGDMYEDKVFRVSVVELINNRNILTNDYNLVKDVVFDKDYSKDNLQRVIVNKNNIEQYYLDTPLSITTIKKAYEQMFESYSYTINDTIFEDFGTIVSMTCIARFPITNEINNSSIIGNDDTLDSSDHMLIYYTFSPLLESIKTLLPFYIIALCLIVIITYFVSASISQKIVRPLSTIPKIIKKNVISYENSSSVEEIDDLIKLLISMNQFDHIN